MQRILLAIVLTVILSPLSYAESFGSWTTGVGTSRTYHYAATVNDSGALLGIYCYPSENSCVWILGTFTTCEKGDSYPILANSDTGAIHLSILCDGKADNKLYRYAFTNFDAINDLIKKGAKVGFAVPLQSDEFRVIRFDLGGSNRAIAAMTEKANRETESSPPLKSNTKDQFL